ncbi:MAG: hypothetical protein U1E62_05225 [Alsobacter sp.]
MSSLRYHNLSNEQLADELGRVDSDIKARSETLDELKDEFKRREITAARGTEFVVTASTSSSKRLDTKRLKDALGEEIVAEYEVESTSTRILVKAAPKLSEVA